MGDWGGGFLPAGSGWTGDKFNLFVSNIAVGIDDGWLERILAAAGQVQSFKRPAQAFAFVEYGDPESVLRCLEVVNGTVLRGRGQPEGTEKALVIKADQKSQARLTEYEATRVKDDNTQEWLSRASDDLQGTLNVMKLPHAPPPSTTNLWSRPSGGQRLPADRQFAHLQDLAVDELPENQRGMITDKIAEFREAAVKKAAEKARQAQAAAAQNRPSSSSSPHLPYGGPQQQGTARSPPGPSQQRAWGTPQRQPSGPPQFDPQSYNKPIGFVPSGGPSSGPGERRDSPGSPHLGNGPAGRDDRMELDSGPLDDERIEQDRVAHRRREAEAIFKDRERRWEARERTKIPIYERDRAKERNATEIEVKDRVGMREKLAGWDDEREAEKGREAFYVDREAWRKRRHTFRDRERENDVRDAEREAAELARSEAFLDQFGAPPPEGGNTPLAGKEEEGVKVSFGGGLEKAAAKAKQAQPVLKQSTGVLGTGEDEEEEGKKKRMLIPLSYSDDEGASSDSSAPKRRREKAAAASAAPANGSRSTGPPARDSRGDRESKVRAIERSLPHTKDEVWAAKVPWNVVTETLVSKYMKPFVTKMVIEQLDEEEEELVSAVLEHVRGHKPPQGLAEELEAILDEDAVDFVKRVYKELIYQALMAEAGL